MKLYLYRDEGNFGKDDPVGVFVVRNSSQRRVTFPILGSLLTARGDVVEFS